MKPPTTLKQGKFGAAGKKQGSAGRAGWAGGQVPWQGRRESHPAPVCALSTAVPPQLAAVSGGGRPGCMTGGGREMLQGKLEQAE